jgi:RNA polymerase sigma factor (sigma-70 family)
MTDATLLREYAESGSRPAMAELVSRHADWIFSAALRMVRDPDLAEDVTQAVFLILMQKAARLGNKPVNAWLFGVTRYAARHALRARARRQRHERLAAIAREQNMNSPPNDIWLELAPMLDDLVERLNRHDRQVILSRFYQLRSLAEIGIGLGISEDAARKRVGKAVSRLRAMFAGHGVSVPMIALATELETNATRAAPPSCSVLPAQPAMNATSISIGVLTMMRLARMKIAAAVLLAIALVPAVVVLALQDSGGNPPDAPAQAQPADPDAANLYVEAAESIKIIGPSEANIAVWPDYPAWSAQWRTLAAASWNANGKARELMHTARPLRRAVWREADPAQMKQMWRLIYLIDDAAAYADSQSNDALAVEEIRDLAHLSELLLASPNPRSYSRSLLAMSADANCSYDFNLVFSNVYGLAILRGGAERESQGFK